MIAKRQSRPRSGQHMPSVLCLDCRHSLLYEHYAGECTCGCTAIRTELPSLWLSQYMRDLQAIYHYNKGTAVGSQAKKAYYTLFEILDQRGANAQALAQATQRQRGPLSGV